MTEYSKYINYIIFFTLLLICLAFSVFLIINWNYISNPELVPGYIDAQATFSHGRDDFAKYRHWGFEYPMDVIPYLMYFQSILLIHLIFRKNLLLSKSLWLAVFTFLVFIIFSDSIFNILSDLFNSNDIRQIGYRFNDFLGVAFFIIFVFLLIASITLMFVSQFKKYRKMLILNLLTILILIIFVVAHFEFFFD
jgi:hypothetical protein